MKNKSRVSRAALAAMVMVLMAMSSVAAEAALSRAPVDPLQRVGEGRMHRAVSDGLRSLSSARMAVPSWMMRFWDVSGYRPLLDVRLRSSK